MRQGEKKRNGIAFIKSNSKEIKILKKTQRLGRMYPVISVSLRLNKILIAVIIHRVLQ